MKLEQSFEVQAPIEKVWAALTDLERVAPCLPGAEITDRDENGTYHGTFQVKLGPTTASYRGTVAIDEADEAARRATLKARGTDKRGQGGASATIVNTLSEHDGGTRVEAVTDFTITGRLAAFGRGGMIKDISNRLMRDFADCLQSRLAAEPVIPPSGVAEPAAAEVTATDTAEPEGTAATPGAPSVAMPTRTSGPVAPASPPLAAASGQPVPPAPSAPPPPRQPAKPVNGLSLVLQVIVERIRRLFGRGS